MKLAEKQVLVRNNKTLNHNHLILKIEGVPESAWRDLSKALLLLDQMVKFYQAPQQLEIKILLFGHLKFVKVLNGRMVNLLQRILFIAGNV